MFSEINKLLENLGLPLPVIDIFLCDFEQAVLQSVKEFYVIARIQACFFHLTQNTHKYDSNNISKIQYNIILVFSRHVVSCGLKELYESDADFSLFVRKLDALGFLPPEEVPDGYRELIEEALPEWNCEGLLEYFSQTYVLGRYKATSKYYTF